MLSSLVNLFFPPTCPVCGAELGVHGAWCPTCLAHTLEPHRLCSPSQEHRKEYSKTARKAVRQPRRAIEHSPILETWALTRYQSASGALLRRLKYQGKKSTLPYIETLVAAGEKHIPKRLLDVNFAIPIPLHQKKERERGFNQTVLIFRPWLTTLGIELSSALTRIIETPPLYDLGRIERARVMQDVFTVRETQTVRERDILLLDDIMTTGATLESAAHTLKQAGAKRVFALVLASDHE